MSQTNRDETSGGTYLPQLGRARIAETLQEIGKKHDQERFEAEKKSKRTPAPHLSEQYAPDQEELERFRKEKEQPQDAPEAEPSPAPEPKPEPTPDARPDK